MTFWQKVTDDDDDDVGQRFIIVMIYDCRVEMGSIPYHSLYSSNIVDNVVWVSSKAEQKKMVSFNFYYHVILLLESRLTTLRWN